MAPILPASALDEAAEALAGGLPVALPTDTVYGIAVDVGRPGATARLFQAKARPLDVALPVLVATVDQADALVTEVPPAARRLMARWWPGGLTIVLRRRDGLGLDLGGPDDATIGLRLPDHPVPVALAARVGPLATTSANRHGQPTPADASGVAAALGDGIALILDGGRCEGAPSTVVDCVDGVRILREGRVPSAAVLATAGH